MSRAWRRGLMALLALSLAPLASAQTDARIGVGVGVTFYESTGKGIDDAVRLTPVVRGRRRGFGPALGFNWLATEVTPALASVPVRGDLRVRPVMAGVSYTHVRGRWATSVAMVAGYAFNSIEPIVPAGGPPLTLDIANSLAAAPSLSVAVDLSRRFGVVTQAGYLMTRPRITARAEGVDDRTRWNADTLVVQMGLVVGLF